jgi:hypothetical protein
MPGWSATAETGIILNDSETALRYCMDVVVSATSRRGGKKIIPDHAGIAGSNKLA